MALFRFPCRSLLSLQSHVTAVSTTDCHAEATDTRFDVPSGEDLDFGRELREECSILVVEIVSIHREHIRLPAELREVFGELVRAEHGGMALWGEERSDYENRTVHESALLIDEGESTPYVEYKRWT
jgi:hypothetical protein